MKKRLLVIDDDDEIRRLLNDIFEADYLVSAVAHVYDIFEAINLYQPDVILLDYKLSEGNGADICYQTKSNAGTHWIPVIMMSGFRQEVLERGHHGWDDFISKPFELEDIRALVAKMSHKNTLRTPYF